MNLNLDNVSTKPGVYLWLDKSGTILYIGKAKNIKKRMQQYFRNMHNSYKTANLVKNIDGFKYIITQTEQEALILERNLIQEHFPPYNILLTDDKRYPYIKIKLGKVLEVRTSYRISNRKENAIYFGPFPFGSGSRKLTNLIQKMTTYENGLPAKNKDIEFWKSKFDYAKKLLSSKSDYLLKEFKSKMKEAATNEQFEIASNLKEGIDALEYHKSKQSVEMLDKSNIDVIAFVESEGYLFISMLFYRMGKMLSEKKHILEIIDSKKDLVRQFVSQYYSFNIKPDKIISNIKIETDINFIVPVKGKNKRILDIAFANATDNMVLNIEKFKRKEERTTGAINKLKKILGLKKLERIIMIDNSNMNNTNPTSGIVSYVNGLKKKSEYRKYKLETRERKADVEYMHQALSRFFLKEQFPIDVLIVDGGKAQINEVKNIVPKGIKLLGLVKDDNHKTKELLDDSGKIIEINDANVWLFLTEIQIEADRFAKAYHVKRRKSSLEGVLISISGIGPNTEKRLLDHFKTYSNIYNASIEDLEKIVSKDLAKKIKGEINENFSSIR